MGRSLATEVVFNLNAHPMSPLFADSPYSGTGIEQSRQVSDDDHSLGQYGQQGGGVEGYHQVPAEEGRRVGLLFGIIARF